jgi:hypothetical protein
VVEACVRQLPFEKIDDFSWCQVLHCSNFLRFTSA